ncbi:hypothetical protein [Adlercreutzia caecimuris]|jgi:hypothetical protein|uniref:hypothetical protein n=1 Tax=Adlercreutzia caecimuris TaxID=671266 RepID=UPI001364B28F|nr:hypothetical protein [Adlercreutzia caecimuris]
MEAAITVAAIGAFVLGAAAIISVDLGQIAREIRGLKKGRDEGDRNGAERRDGGAGDLG